MLVHFRATQVPVIKLGKQGLLIQLILMEMQQVRRLLLLLAPLVLRQLTILPRNLEEHNSRWTTQIWNFSWKSLPRASLSIPWRLRLLEETAIVSYVTCLFLKICFWVEMITFPSIKRILRIFWWLNLVVTAVLKLEIRILGFCWEVLLLNQDFQMI